MNKKFNTYLILKFIFYVYLYNFLKIVLFQIDLPIIENNKTIKTKPRRSI